MLLLKLVFLSLISCMTTDLRVLFFTMDSCPPCKATEPHVDQLARDGISVSKIDVRRQGQYAQQCQVSNTPTVIIANGNEVVARHSGAMSYGQLRQMVSHAERRARESAASKTATPAHTASTTNRRPQATTANLTPQQKAHRATVRFRVEDNEGTSFATGTIIHKNGNEALVLTCGHVFRDSNGQGKINADIGFYNANPTTVVGKLLFYDAKQHDIALVAIPCPLDIQPIPVAPEQLSVQTGDQIFSLGCDRGKPPTIRNSVLKAVTRYSGVSKYDIVGRPVDGRSGGGLFSAGGQLIGVCNAAAVEVDEGIYTGLQSIYWQFAKSNLTHLFKRDAVKTQLTFDTQPAERTAPISQLASQTNLPTERGLDRPQSTVQLAHPSERTSTARDLAAQQVVARGNELTPPASRPIHRGGPVPVNTAIYRGGGVPVRNASATVAPSNHQRATDSSVEVIVLVRSKQDPRRMETITIPNPDQRTLDWLASQSSQEPGSSGTRMARLPELQPPRDSANQPEMRAQSPR